MPQCFFCEQEYIKRADPEPKLDNKEGLAVNFLEYDKIEYGVCPTCIKALLLGWIYQIVVVTDRNEKARSIYAKKLIGKRRNEKG